MLFTGLKVIKSFKCNMDLLYLFPNMKSNCQQKYTHIFCILSLTGIRSILEELMKMKELGLETSSNIFTLNTWDQKNHPEKSVFVEARFSCIQFNNHNATLAYLLFFSLLTSPSYPLLQCASLRKTNICFLCFYSLKVSVNPLIHNIEKWPNIL